MYDSRLGIENAVGCHHRDGRTLGVGEDFGFTILDFIIRALSVQINAEPAGGVHATHLLVEVQVNFFVDHLQGAADGHDRAVCLQHAAIAAEHAHTGANGRLSQVNRRNVAFLKLLQRRAQFAAQLVHQIPAGRLRCILRTLAADQNDGGGKGVGALGNRAHTSFCSHGPSTSNGKTSVNHGTEHGFPA